MRQRVVSALIGGSIFIAIMLIKGWVITVSAMLMAVIGVLEFNKAFENKGYHPSKPMAILFSLFLMGSFLLSPQLPKGLIVALGLMLFYAFLAYHVFSKHTIVDVVITVFSVVYIVVPFILIMGLAQRTTPLIWLVFIIAWSSDTFAYFVGKKIGKTKLTDVSPNKTLEGLVGGVVGCVIAVWAYRYFLDPNFPLAMVLVVGVTGSFASVTGDLTASKIKRYCDIKDFGHLIPGHGGVMDRFDSMLFTAPVVYIFSWIIQLAS